MPEKYLFSFVTDLEEPMFLAGRICLQTFGNGWIEVRKVLQWKHQDVQLEMKAFDRAWSTNFLRF